MWWNLAGQRLLGVLAGPGASVTPPGHLWFTALQIAPWAIIDAKLAVDAAAFQATRDFVEADVPAADDFGEAEAEARLAGYEVTIFVVVTDEGVVPGLAARAVSAVR